MRDYRKVHFFLLVLILLCLFGCGKAEENDGSAREPISVTKREATNTPTPTKKPKPTRKPTARPTSGGQATPTPSPRGENAPLRTGEYDAEGHLGTGDYEKAFIIDLFNDVAMNVEYGDTGSGFLRRWETPLLLWVIGDRTEADEQTIAYLMQMLNKIPGFPGLEYANSREDANVLMSFLAGNDYEDFRKEYIDEANTSGFVTSYYFGSGYYGKAVIGIRSDRSDSERRTVIMEETIQSLGLLNDTYLDPESLFYQGYNELEEPTGADWLLVKLLYHEAFSCGMKQEEVDQLLETILVE